MSKKKPIIVTAIVSVVITLAVSFIFNFITMSDTERLKLLILSTHTGNVTEEKLEEGAKRGMIAALGDPYSVYFDEEEYAMFLEEMDASYTGIGVEIQMKDGKLYVLSPFEGSPAEKAGLRPGDVIEKVDDLTITEETYAEAISRMRNRNTETSLVLTVRRDTEILSISVSPETIKIDTVKAENYGDITYIRIRSFDSPTAGEMKAAIESAEKRNARGLIIDVRDNPGGYLESVADIADMLLPQSTIVYTKNKDGKRESLYESDGECTQLPIVLLVNENSASASEVLAGALKDNGRAKLVGQKTFGKGSVQSLFKLRNGGAKITVAEYFTAGGYNINGNGVEPDFVIENTGEEDMQLKKALSLFNE
ncbi:MAG: S41 family peptidase [Clostridia bacterium]|nr:S41 family peptidase [Clostridia bacterium]